MQSDMRMRIRVRGGVHCLQDNAYGSFWTLMVRDNTGQFKKKVTLSHVYNEVTSELTITRYTTIVRKLSKIVCN
jgi:hypothetical protein